MVNFRCLALAVLLMCLARSKRASAERLKPVQFRFTFRAFQPQHCMTKEYFSQYCKQQDFRKLARLQKRFCLRKPYMNGHPDFGPMDSCQIDVPTGPRQIVARELQYDESGLGKPVYCNNDTLQSIFKTGKGFLCGKRFKQANGRRLYPYTTGKDRFDEWYRDVLGVNKRVGVSLQFLEDTIVSDEDGEGYFEGRFRQNHSSIVTVFDSNDSRFYKTKPGFFPLDGFTVANGGESTEPLEFQTVWPKWKHAFDHKFSFTTEFHSVFTYYGGEVFKFKGDDDVYVYINGLLELDLGGRHEAHTGYIFLDKLMYSTLIVNETYTIDLFHAERLHPRSNFAIASTLVAPMSIGDIGLTGFDWHGGNESEFAFLGSIPTQDQGVNTSLHMLDITDLSHQEEVGYVLLQRKLLVNKGFIVKIGVSISSAGCSGFTVLLQNGEVANLPLTGRDLRISEFDGVGSAQGETSLGLTLDLCKNWVKPVFNPSSCEQEIRLHTNGQTKTFVARSSIVGKLADGRVHNFVLSYSAATEYLEVFIDDSLYMLQTKFKASDYLGTAAANVGISIFQDSIVPVESKLFEDVKVELHSFKVVVAEFRTSHMFTTMDIVVLSTLAALMLLTLCTTICSNRRAILRSLHSSVAFVEDTIAIFLLVEKACELCPGMPSTELFLIFLGVELLFQIVPHITRHSPSLRFCACGGIETMQLFLFLNLLEDTVNSDSSDIFVVCVLMQIGLLGLETIRKVLNNFKEKQKGKEGLHPLEKDKCCGVLDKAIVYRTCSDCIGTLVLSALPLATVFVYPRTSTFQEKWFQILVAKNLWYRGVVIDSMVENLSDEEYSNYGCLWSSEGRVQLRKEWRAWAYKEQVLATSSVGHTLLVHLVSAMLAIMHLAGEPPVIEVVFSSIIVLAIPSALLYACNVWKIIRVPDVGLMDIKVTTDEPL